MKPLITSVLTILTFASCGFSQNLPDRPVENSVTARSHNKTPGTSIWRAMVLEGRELHPSLRTRRADEPIWHVRPGTVFPRNPHVSNDTDFVEAVSRSASMGKISREGVRSALYASYADKEKRVLFRGLETMSALDVVWREAALRALWSKNMSLDRVRIHRKGLLLVVVWHKGLSPECWDAVNTKVAKQLSIP